MANPSLLLSRLFTNRFSQIPHILGLRLKTTANVGAPDSPEKPKIANEGVVYIPEKPKKPLNPFLRYSQEHRKLIRNQHPGWNAAHLSQQLSKDWSNLSADLKEQYTKEYKAELDVYHDKYAKYLSELTDEHKAAIQKQKEKESQSKEAALTKQILKKLEKPKKPVSALITFAVAESKARNVPYMDFIQIAKGKFDALPEAEQEKYRQDAKDARLLYDISLKEWEQKMISTGYLPFVRANTLKETIKSKVVEVPKKSRKIRSRKKSYTSEAPSIESTVKPE